MRTRKEDVGTRNMHILETQCVSQGVTLILDPQVWGKIWTDNLYALC